MYAASSFGLCSLVYVRMGQGLNESAVDWCLVHGSSYIEPHPGLSTQHTLLSVLIQQTRPIPVVTECKEPTIVRKKYNMASREPK